MKSKLYLTFFFLNSICVFSQITPEISSWIRNNSVTGFNGILTNVQQVQYSANNIYITATCIPGYDIGPWSGNPNTATNQNFVFKITRNPVQNTGTLINTGLGHIGVFTNGVSIFNPKDGMSYNNQNVWQQNAIVVEGPSFDECLGHPAGNGEYHHHLNPTCLYDDTLSNVHSPIIGYAFDGFPVYGAYAFTNTDGTGVIKRMQSSYQTRNITTRTTLPNGNTASSAGPIVSATYPIGYYVQDFIYTAGSGDLDRNNGRFCITPEFPAGKYCYFVTLDSNLVAQYPYLIGPTYYGTVQAGNTGPGSGHNIITETVLTYNGSLGIAEYENNLEFKIFPNPASSTLNIMLQKDLPNNLEFEIVDNLGRKVYVQENFQPTITYSIDISKYSKGIYYAIVKSEKNTMTKKIIIE